jgi:hypothetical protein
MKKFLLYLPILVAIFLIAGCNYQNPVVMSDCEYLDNPGLGPNDPYIVNMITSGNTAIGILKVWKDRDFMHCEFTAKSNYSFGNIHLHITPDKSKIPMSGGCPDLDKFRYTIHNLPANTKSYAFSYPIIKYPVAYNYYYITAEIDFENSVDHPDCNYAWAAGLSFTTCSDFAKYFTFKING